MMDVLGMELAGFTLGDQFSSVLEGSGPIETLPESFPGKGP